jgi:hypothetical protein
MSSNSLPAFQGTYFTTDSASGGDTALGTVHDYAYSRYQFNRSRYLMSTLRKSPECTGASLSLTMLMMTSSSSATHTTTTKTAVATPAAACPRHLEAASSYVAHLNSMHERTKPTLDAVRYVTSTWTNDVDTWMYMHALENVLHEK